MIHLLPRWNCLTSEYLYRILKKEVNTITDTPWHCGLMAIQSTGLIQEDMCRVLYLTSTLKILALINNALFVIQLQHNEDTDLLFTCSNIILIKYN